MLKKDINHPSAKIAMGLAELRKFRKLTQAELAGRLRTKQTVISRIESGVAVPSWAFIQRMAEVLNAEVDITFKPLEKPEMAISGRPYPINKYVCVNCLYKWESKLDRIAIRCPKCHKRHGVLSAGYSKALAAFHDLKMAIKDSPPCKKAPPLKSIKQNSQVILRVIRETIGGTFPNPKLPARLLYKIFEQLWRD
jgi:transcriptional regulator with XRE-family HTH domain